MADLGGTGSAGLKPGIVMSCVFATCEYNAVHGKRASTPSAVLPRGRWPEDKAITAARPNRSWHRRRAAHRRRGEEPRSWLVLVARCRLHSAQKKNTRRRTSRFVMHIPSLLTLAALCWPHEVASEVTAAPKQLPAYSTPVSVQFERNGPGAAVSLCSLVNLTIPPTLIPFYSNLLEDGCTGGSSELNLATLADLLARETPEERWHRPSGFIVHAMRTGSTAAANMVGAHPDVIVLKEPEAWTDVLMAEEEAAAAVAAAAGAADDDDDDDDAAAGAVPPPRLRKAQRRTRELALRTIAQLFFRAAASQRLNVLPGTIESAHAQAQRTTLVVKLASAGTATPASLRLLRDAFPDVPFAYMIRDPATSVASLLAPSKPDELLQVPCLRWRGRPLARQLAAVRKLALSGDGGDVGSGHSEGVPRAHGGAPHTDPFALSVEQYCGAHLAAVHHAMLAQIAEDDLRDAQLSLVFDHAELPHAVPERVMPHFGLPLTGEALDRCLAWSHVDAKDPGSKEVGYKKRAVAPAARRWATVYCAESYERLLLRGAPPGGKGRDASEALAAAKASAMEARRNTSAGLGRFAHTAGLAVLGAGPGGDERVGPSAYPHECALAPTLDASSSVVSATGEVAGIVGSVPRMVLYAEHGVGLFTRGDLLGAEACWAAALSLPEGTEDDRAKVLMNLATVEGILGRDVSHRVTLAPHNGAFRSEPDGETLAAAREAHARTREHLRDLAERAVQEEQRRQKKHKHKKQKQKKHPQKARPADGGGASEGGGPRHHSPTLDPALLVFDDVLSPSLCETILRAFETIGAPEHYVGNVGTSSGFIVKPQTKLDTEIDISHSPNAAWDGIEFALLQALLGALHTYAGLNPGLSTPAQLREEGFRLKRYRSHAARAPHLPMLASEQGLLPAHQKSLPQHHAWHADSGAGSEATGCRAIAAVFYLNDVEEGGETIFSSPDPTAVQPRQGRLLLFPTSFNYHHAGAPPVSHHKYIATTFVTPCSAVDKRAMPPQTPLSLGRRQALRAQWGGTTPADVRISFEQLLDFEGVEQGVDATVGVASEATAEATSEAEAGREVEADAEAEAEAEAEVEAEAEAEVQAEAEARAAIERKSPAVTEAEAQCGGSFAASAAAELDLRQRPRDCFSARLLVFGTATDAFEGLGSVMMQLAHAQAEAFFSNRTLLWGAAEAQPPILGGARCDGGAGRGGECLFQPLGTCTWQDHVFADEAARIVTAPQADAERVTLQNVFRGGPGMYVVPPRLHDLLPDATKADAAAAAECWAGAVMARVMRLRPELAAELDARAMELLGDAWPTGSRRSHGRGGVGVKGEGRSRLSGVHLRAGDVAALRDVYTHRHISSIGELGQALTQAWGGKAKDVGVVYLATDAEDAASLAPRLAKALDGGKKRGRLAARVVLAPNMYRPTHGPHSTAFAASALRGEHEMTLPGDVSASVAAGLSKRGAEEEGALKERVRTEALLDLYVLSGCAVIAGAASSTFAVAARLWGVGRAAEQAREAAEQAREAAEQARAGEQRADAAGGAGAPAQAQRGGAIWTDLEQVASGELTTGFLRGMRNGTQRLVDGSERTAVALARMLGRRPLPFLPKLTFDPATAIPIVPNVTFFAAAGMWASSSAPSAGHWCACDPTTMPASCDPTKTACEPARLGCDAAELTNLGVELYDGYVMNDQGAEACWRRALMLPGRTKHADFTAPAPAADVSDVARGNLLVLLAKHANGHSRYGKLARQLARRGGGRDREEYDNEQGKGGGAESACCQQESGGVTARKVRLHIEGWRSVSHSYAVTAVSLAQALACRCDVELSWSDAPVPDGFLPAMNAQPLALPARIRVLPFGASPMPLPPATKGLQAAETAALRPVILRMTWPYNLSAPTLPRDSPPTGGRPKRAGAGGAPPTTTGAPPPPPPAAPAALVFATAEHLACPGGLAPGSPSWRRAPKSSVALLTPSEWSREGLAACGMSRERIAVAPHGVGLPLLLGTDAAARAPTVSRDERRRRGWGDRFVLLHVGAATPNKNLGALLRSYARAVRRVLHARREAATTKRQGDAARHLARVQLPLLVLKGLDVLYGSGDSARAAVSRAFNGTYVAWSGGAGADEATPDGPPEHDEEPDEEPDTGRLDAERYVQLIGDDLDAEGMAALYLAADGYASASMAEAFQMPLAEATAAGLPVIVPAGGAAEEVCDPVSATFVPSAVFERISKKEGGGGGGGVLIRVDEDALTEALTRLLLGQNAGKSGSPKASDAPAVRGPLWAKEHLSLRHSADKVLAAVMQIASRR